MNAAVIQVLVGMGLLFFGFYKVWKMIEYYRRRSASVAWPVLSGEVLSKRVVETRTLRSGPSYRPEITYRYTVMGQEFEEIKRLLGPYSRNSAEKAVNDFAERIELRYNPENPAEHITDLDRVKILDILLILSIFALAGYTLYRFLI